MNLLRLLESECSEQGVQEQLLVEGKSVLVAAQSPSPSSSDNLRVKVNLLESECSKGVESKSALVAAPRLPEAEKT